MKLREIFFFALIASCAAGLLLFPTQSAQAARDAMSLCFQTIIPSLFPFFVLSSLFISCGAANGLSHALRGVMRPLFGLSGAGASALTLGLLGGYPVGVRTVIELFTSDALSRKEAERLLGFCNNAGPGFILGMCAGAVFHSPRTGLYLYLVHVSSAVLTGIHRLYYPRRGAKCALRYSERLRLCRPLYGAAAAFPAAASVLCVLPSALPSSAGFCRTFQRCCGAFLLASRLCPVRGAARMGWAERPCADTQRTGRVLSLHTLVLARKNNASGTFRTACMGGFVLGFLSYLCPLS